LTRSRSYADDKSERKREGLRAKDEKGNLNIERPGGEPRLDSRSKRIEKRYRGGKKSGFWMMRENN